MQRLRIALAAAAAAVIGVIGLVASPARADTSAWYGCSGGWACLYASDSPYSSIIGSYYYYGYHNLSNVLGTHLFLNNQTNDPQTGVGAFAYVCFNYGGTNCPLELATQGGNGYFGWVIGDFTPINSVRLSRYYQAY